MLLSLLIEAPGAGPDALPSSTGDTALNADQTLTGPRAAQCTSGSESEDEQHSETGSLLEGNYQDSKDQPETTPGTNLQIRNYLRRPATERQSEA